MKTKAVRLYGKQDLRLEEFELPAIGDNEILARVMTDSICMSTHKAAILGPDHKRVPDDVALRPVIVGHEFCGELLEVGSKWADTFKAGGKFVIQTAINDPANVYAAPGYSFHNIGGAATHVVIPSIVMEHDCLLPFDGEAFYHGSLTEPMSCIVGGYHANYHTRAGSYVHEMGIVPGGKMALLAGAGPMGLGAIDYALHADRRPSLLVATDIDDGRLARASSLLTVAEAARQGVALHYVNTAKVKDVPAYLRGLTGGKGYDDVYVYAPVSSLVEQADAILGHDGCLNFFAGPTDPAFSAGLNFYNVHYMATHVAGNTGGNAADMREALLLMSAGRIDPSTMVTHIGGLDVTADTTLRLPQIPGGKKLIYNQISLPLTAISDFADLGKTDPMFAQLARLTAANNGLWSPECERVLFKHAKAI